jgi:hypothetical protein
MSGTGDEHFGTMDGRDDDAFTAFTAGQAGQVDSGVLKLSASSLQALAGGGRQRSGARSRGPAATARRHASNFPRQRPSQKNKRPSRGSRTPAAVHTTAVPPQLNALMGAVDNSANVMWILYCGTLVFLMQAGFAMLCARRRRHFTLHAAEPT